jgi:hypothetical protein
MKVGLKRALLGNTDDDQEQATAAKGKASIIIKVKQWMRWIGVCMKMMTWDVPLTLWKDFLSPPNEENLFKFQTLTGKRDKSIYLPTYLPTALTTYLSTYLSTYLPRQAACWSSV